MRPFDRLRLILQRAPIEPSPQNGAQETDLEAALRVEPDHWQKVYFRRRLVRAIPP